jgi:hypothetical protein
VTSAYGQLADLHRHDRWERSGSRAVDGWLPFGRCAGPRVIRHAEHDATTRSRRFTRRRRFGKAGHDDILPIRAGNAAHLGHLVGRRDRGVAGWRSAQETAGRLRRSDGQPRRVVFPASAISAIRHRRPSACPHQFAVGPPAPPARQVARPSMSCFKISNYLAAALINV